MRCTGSTGIADLKVIGFAVLNANAVSALHRMNHYDLILLDLQMPGMDGFQVMECLKISEMIHHCDDYLSVLVITAQSFIGYRGIGVEAGK